MLQRKLKESRVSVTPNSFFNKNNIKDVWKVINLYNNGRFHGIALAKI